MKQNLCAVVGEVAKPKGVDLDELDGAVESFSTGVADFVLAEVKRTSLVMWWASYFGQFVVVK